MNLLERYLQAVGQYLAPETREDVLAEWNGINDSLHKILKDRTKR